MTEMAWSWTAAYLLVGLLCAAAVWHVATGKAGERDYDEAARAEGLPDSRSWPHALAIVAIVAVTVVLWPLYAVGLVAMSAGGGRRDH